MGEIGDSRKLEGGGAALYFFVGCWSTRASKALILDCSAAEGILMSLRNP